MADSPEQAEVRRQLRARGEALAPRVTPGGSSARRPPAGRTAATVATRPRRASPTTSTATRPPSSTPPPTTGADDTGPRGGRRSRRTQLPPVTPVGRLIRAGDRTHRGAARGIGILEGAGRGGQHTLMAELLIFAGVVGIRALAQYGPDVPAQDKQAVTPKGSFGPLFLLGSGLGVFFVLSLVAARGGRAARWAAMFGLLIDVSLLVKSEPHIKAVRDAYAAPRTYTPLDLTGTYQHADAPVGGTFSSSLSTALADVGQQAGVSVGQATAVAGSTVTQIITGLAKQFGWTSTADIQGWQYVLTRESGGSPTARNPQSGALGAAQALGHGNANTAGTLGNEYGGFGLTDAQAKEANSGNLAMQLLWMANYIKATYGNPANAAAHEQANNWY